MSRTPDDSTATCRAAARRLMVDLRRRAVDVGLPGCVAVADLVEEAARQAAAAAGEWASREGRHRFLVELGGEARSEWMIQPEPDSPRSLFYETFRERLSEMARVARK